MGNRKESIKKALGITEYPWSSDDDEDNSGQRANNQDPHAATSQQRQTSETRTKAELFRNMISRILHVLSSHECCERQLKDYLKKWAEALCKQQDTAISDPPAWLDLISCRPFSPSLPYVIATNSSTPRQRSAVSQQNDFGQILDNVQGSNVHPYNINRSRYRNMAQQDLSTPPSNHLRTHQNQVGAESRRPSADIQRIVAFKKLTRGLLRLRNRPSNYVAISARTAGSPVRNQIFTPQSTPETTRNVRDILASETRRLNANRYNVGSLFTVNNSSPNEPMPSSSGIQQSLTLNVKSEENSNHDEATDGVPNVDISFSDNDGDDAPTSTRPARNDSQMVQETLEDPAQTSCADARTGEEVVIEAPNVFDSNGNQNVAMANMQENANEESNAGTSNAAGTAAEPQLIGSKRKRDGTEQNEEVFTVKEFNQGLLRLLECPVCLDWMEPPISQCRRGHLVCGRCRSRLSACPVCRSLFSSVRNRAMEGVAEMLRYPCRHGCGREVKLRRRGPHEASCRARKYHCPALACSERMPMPHSELAQHFQSKHFSMLIIGKKHKFSMKVTAEQHDNWLIMAFDEFFHLRVDVDFPTWGIIVYVSYIGPKCNASNFIYEVSVDGQHHARKVVYSRVTHSDIESASLNLSRQDCFHLNLDQALNFLRFKNRNYEPEKFLDFHVEISRSDLEVPDGDKSDS